MNEATITAAIRKELHLMARGGDLFFFKVHGSAVQRPGIPDWFILWRGRSIFIEVKKPKGKATEIQNHVMEKIRRAGGMACVVHSVDEFRDVMRSLDTADAQP